MPIDPNAVHAIREHLCRIANGEKPRIITIGELTPEQLEAICAERRRLGLPELESPELVYLGRHHYESRSVDGYTVEDMILQLQSSLSPLSQVQATIKMTAMQNLDLRADGYGSAVADRAVLELTARKPRAEVYSVIPKGDGGGPKNKKGP